MIPPHSHNLKQRFSVSLARCARWTGSVALALGSAGCFAPFIPLAIQGVGMVGKAIAGTAEAGTMVKHGNDADPEETEVMEETRLDGSDFNSTSAKNPANTDKCNELELITPAIIEFRTDPKGVPQWRELGLGGSADAPRWTVLAEIFGASAKAHDIAPGGWAPANNLEHMEFTPPLETSAVPGHGSFMAYAPATALAPVERDELTSLVLDFGPVVGTFKYHDRVFKYATLERLPCFPVAAK
jgi:hypothetical protein